MLTNLTKFQGMKCLPLLLCSLLCLVGNVDTADARALVDMINKLSAKAQKQNAAPAPAKSAPMSQAQIAKSAPKAVNKAAPAQNSATSTTCKTAGSRDNAAALAAMVNAKTESIKTGGKPKYPSFDSLPDDVVKRLINQERTGKGIFSFKDGTQVEVPDLTEWNFETEGTWITIEAVEPTTTAPEEITDGPEPTTEPKLDDPKLPETNKNTPPGFPQCMLSSGFIFEIIDKLFLKTI
ncbi:hypothetical protein PMAYCL1PPCAC_10450 [Pristionchus mayeri]|uniref:Uncharacterized protein n=1 Tax=Pristionchus mayeri TaxID=1317129 RepID=A0AAN4ZMD2_9BILA|nr:hypothetical protein PMAYCL1PPCAC_10450 [Pristionchus mayeri]